jgi:hypothetical protein
MDAFTFTVESSSTLQMYTCHIQQNHNSSTYFTEYVNQDIQIKKERMWEEGKDGWKEGGREGGKGKKGRKEGTKEGRKEGRKERKKERQQQWWSSSIPFGMPQFHCNYKVYTLLNLQFQM